MPKFRSTRDYTAARESGDTETASRIVNDLTARVASGQATPAELHEVYDANQSTPLADPK
ncbi:hypothetical protein IX27_18175 [Streptomyces sp. JS01]|uniref:hypothetical protein n=1 Tax=Streptomyces sp. JS01 TaxID=1525753 RepID=UPI000503B6B0|nr:hypothetical protein [Streptomyces sp. JS01]KFK87819.1 hypothetical protein IX27_18175 [Streptomyces sp. JS01]